MAKKTPTKKSFVDLKIDPRIFFGYGSLMNSDTIKTIGDGKVYRGILFGWVRSWAKTSSSAYMNAIYTGDKTDILLGGVISIDEDSHLKTLQAREAFYDEYEVEVLHSHPDNRNLGGTIFSIDYRDRSFERIITPCTMSYVLTCAQGMANLFGEESIKSFFKDTVGWPAIKDDRNFPSYPRASYTDEVQEKSLKIIKDMDIPIVSSLNTEVIPLEGAKKKQAQAKDYSKYKGRHYYGGYYGYGTYGGYAGEYDLLEDDDWRNKTDVIGKSTTDKMSKQKDGGSKSNVKSVEKKESSELFGNIQIAMQM